MEQTFKVIVINRHDVTDNHYQVLGGLTKEEIKAQFSVTEDDFNSAYEDTGEGERGYLGKDGLNEYELELE